MGVFFEPSDEPSDMRFAIAGAFANEPEALKDPDAAALVAANAARGARGAPKQFNTRNFLVALVIFFAVVILAIVTNALNLATSTQALWGLAGSIFGVIVGLLGGEKGS